MEFGLGFIVSDGVIAALQRYNTGTWSSVLEQDLGLFRNWSNSTMNCTGQNIPEITEGWWTNIKVGMSFLRGWWKKEGGEQWRDKVRGVSSFCSEYIFAVSWWRRSRRRQKTQFLFSRTITTGLPSLRLLPPSSAFVCGLRRWDGAWKKFCFGRGL